MLKSWKVQFVKIFFLKLAASQTAPHSQLGNVHKVKSIFRAKVRRHSFVVGHRTWVSLKKKFYHSIFKRRTLPSICSFIFISEYLNVFQRFSTFFNIFFWKKLPISFRFRFSFFVFRLFLCSLFFLFCYSHCGFCDIINMDYWTYFSLGYECYVRVMINPKVLSFQQQSFILIPFF